MTRTRFYLHPENRLDLPELRNAVYAWLYSSHDGGEYAILPLMNGRTDALDAVNNRLGDLSWLGLNPALPGLPSEIQPVPAEPIREFSDRLLKDGHAYSCYCTDEEIRKRDPSGRYDGRCRTLTDADRRNFESEGRKPVIRFFPSGSSLEWTDPVLGRLSAQPPEIRDPVLLDTDGHPAPLFMETILDARFSITHVFRDSRQLALTYAQALLSRTLDIGCPQFIHLPTVLKADKGLPELRQAGYSPDAIVNFVALLGWSHPEGRVILDRDETVRSFSPGGISSEPVYCDAGRRDWIAKHHLVNSPVDRLYDEFQDYLKKTGTSGIADLNTEFVKGFLELVRGYCSTFAKMAEHLTYFASDEFPVADDAKTVLKKPESVKVLETFNRILSAEEWEMSEAVFQDILSRIGRELNVRGRSLFLPLRAALSGRTDGPEVYYLIPVIGKDRAIRRIGQALNGPI